MNEHLSDWDLYTKVCDKCGAVPPTPIDFAGLLLRIAVSDPDFRESRCLQPRKTLPNAAGMSN